MDEIIISNTLDDIEEKSKEMLKIIEQMEHDKKLAKEMASSYSPPTHSICIYCLEMHTSIEKTMN